MEKRKWEDRKRAPIYEISVNEALLVFKNRLGIQRNIRKLRKKNIKKLEFTNIDNNALLLIKKAALNLQKHHYSIKNISALLG